MVVPYLPNFPSLNSSIYSEITSNNTKTTTTIPPPLDSIILVLSSLIIILASYPTFKLTKYKLDKRTLEKLSQKDYSESLKPTTRLKELSEKVESKLELRDKIIPKEPKLTNKKFIPKRRR
ncbi:MAG: hypothetical protein ACXADY_11295 [Candidatus Hodarchaeales archaeon]